MRPVLSWEIYSFSAAGSGTYPWENMSDETRWGFANVPVDLVSETSRAVIHRQYDPASSPLVRLLSDREVFWADREGMQIFKSRRRLKRKKARNPMAQNGFHRHV